MAATAVVIGALATTGAIGYGAYSQHTAQEDAKDERSAAVKAQEKRDKEAKDALTKQSATLDATTARDQARERQKRLASDTSGRASTLLTTSLPSTQPTQPKTLLGA